MLYVLLQLLATKQFNVNGQISHNINNITEDYYLFYHLTLDILSQNEQNVHVMHINPPID